VLHVDTREPGAAAERGRATPVAAARYAFFGGTVPPGVS
jgi:hypothetical protein